MLSSLSGMRSGMHVDGLHMLFMNDLVYRAPAETNSPRGDTIVSSYRIYNIDSGPSRQARPRHLHEKRESSTYTSVNGVYTAGVVRGAGSAGADTSAPEVVESALIARSTLRPACDNPHLRSAPASDRVFSSTGPPFKREAQHGQRT
jgi:hypothetical protein